MTQSDPTTDSLTPRVSIFGVYSSWQNCTFLYAYLDRWCPGPLVWVGLSFAVMDVVVSVSEPYS